jgi:hypothetical protein
MTTKTSYRQRRHTTIIVVIRNINAPKPSENTGFSTIEGRKRPLVD